MIKNAKSLPLINTYQGGSPFSPSVLRRSLTQDALELHETWGLFGWIDLAATFIFALEGGMAARDRKLNFVGVTFIAAILSLGGGMTRDILLQKRTWINKPLLNSVIILLAVIVLYIAYDQLALIPNLIYFADAFSLGVFTLGGIWVSHEISPSSLLGTLCGLITATVGGIWRDICFSKMPDRFTDDGLYSTASILGSLGYYIANEFFDRRRSGVTCVASVIIVRTITWLLVKEHIIQ